MRKKKHITRKPNLAINEHSRSLHKKASVFSAHNGETDFNPSDIEESAIFKNMFGYIMELLLLVQTSIDNSVVVIKIPHSRYLKG